MACFGDRSGHIFLHDDGLRVRHEDVLGDRYSIGFRDMDGVGSRVVLDDGYLDGVWNWAVDWHWHVLGDLDGVWLGHRHSYWAIYWHGDL